MAGILKGLLGRGGTREAVEAATSGGDLAAERQDVLPEGVTSGIAGFDRGSLRPTETRETKTVVVSSEEDDGKAEEASAGGAGGADVARVMAASKAGRKKRRRTVADDVSAPEEVHGWRFADRTWAPAVRVVDCDDEARPGYATRKAHEYLETDETLRAKVAALADMIRMASNAVAYTGAGMSTASGIGDYASKSKKSLGAGASRPKLRTPLAAQPTLAHHVLVQMFKAGQLAYVINQNHDGLCAKAGLPESAVNEIHGSWWDPSNPVVPMSGQLRTDLFEDMMEWELKADMVMAIGTSLCGMNADRVFTTCAQRAQTGDESALGGVIVSLQRTQYDDIAALRIYAKIDDVAALLAEELGLTDAVKRARRSGPYSLHRALKAIAGKGALRTAEVSEDIFEVPYDARTGKLAAEGAEPMRWNLTEGAKVKLTAGPYAGDEGEVMSRMSDGHWRIQFKHCVNPKRSKTKVPFVRVLGAWWVESAVLASVPALPIVNIGTSRVTGCTRGGAGGRRREAA